MGINLGYSYNTEVRNEIAPAPRFNGLTVGVSIPLKFSSFNKGEVNAARAEVRQNAYYLEAARQKVRSEAIQAYVDACCNSFVCKAQLDQATGYTL